MPMAPSVWLASAPSCQSLPPLQNSVTLIYLCLLLGWVMFYGATGFVSSPWSRPLNSQGVEQEQGVGQSVVDVPEAGEPKNNVEGCY